MIKSFQFLIVAALLTLLSCSKSNDVIDGSSKDDEGTTGSTGSTGTSVSDALHLSFKTPDWNRQIDCSQLDLSGQMMNDSLRTVSAQSQSTSELFRLSYPADSSAMAKAGNLKKYKINNYTEYQTGAFQFSQRLPMQSGSSTVLFSKDGLADNSFNEIVSIKYAQSTSTLAYFNVKARYSMMMYDRDNPGTTKLVTGTYHFKVGTRKK